MEVGTSTSLGSSQNIVDELFKDFISKKISKTKVAAANKDVPKPAKVDEISKLLDLEISSIQAQTKEPIDRVKDGTSGINQKYCKSTSAPQTLSSELKNNSTVDATANIPLPPLPPHEPLKDVFKTVDESKIDRRGDSSTSVSSAHFTNSAELLPTATKAVVGSLAKKLNIPKKLGCKLSTESLSLIKSKEKIDRNGRVWEDGEVQSSNSDQSNKEDSDSDDNDGYPSETGSINSDKDDWKSPRSSSSKHKKKHHKHKHKKKKKKKSSKEKDRPHNKSDDERDSKKSKEKEKEKRSKRDKEESSSNSNNKDEHDADRERKSDDRVKEKENGDDKYKRRESDSESLRRDRKVSDKDKNDNRKRDKEKKRKYDRSRSRSPKRSKRSRSRSRSPRKSGRTISPRRSRYGEWDARRYSDDPKKFSRSRSRSRSPGRLKRRRSSDKKRDRSPDGTGERSADRKRDKSKERDKDRDLRLQIDKAKLRKIAIANALNSMKSGQPVPVQLDVATVKSGGKSVEELTDFCKRISEKEQEKVDNAISDSSEEEIAPPHSDEEEPLIHHPFKVKDTSANIVMNIRNAKQLPVLTPSEKQAQQASLRLAFPVSSGTHHRASESEWVPVEKTTALAVPTTSKPVNSKSTTESQPEKKDSIFPTTTSANVDIGAIISERLQAVRKLQANPYDVQALSTMHKAQEKASQWAQSKHLPGQFVGSTGAQVMSQEELMGDKRRQAWVKKTQFSTATPVSGGIGMFLLQKMGWKQGEGLGKNNEGSTQPLQLDIKIDRKGLQSAADNPKSKPQIAHVPQAKDLSHKHPVSALMELCNKRRWGPPNFTVVQEDGPAHKKCFLFKVKVNNVEYQPAVPSSNKKSAKAQCAAVCLQEMGLLPRDAHVNY